MSNENTNSTQETPRQVLVNRAIVEILRLLIDNMTPDEDSDGYHLANQDQKTARELLRTIERNALVISI